MKNVVITGADGFIGKALTKKLLKSGINVLAIVKNKEKLNDIVCDNLKYIEMDFSMYQDYANDNSLEYDVFYHLAWDGVFGEAFKDYTKQLNNAKYSADALMLAKKLNCKKFVIVGTVNQLEVEHYMKVDSCNPRYTVIYGTAKIAADMICKTLAYQNGMEYNSVLLAMSYGENNYSNMIPNVVMRALNSGNSPKLTVGDYYYDMIYIEDIACGLIAVGNSGINQKQYYLGHRKLRLFKEIIKEIGEIINPSVELKFGEYPDATSIDYSLIDLDALYNDTGFECQSDFKESIKNTAKWILDNNI